MRKNSLWLFVIVIIRAYSFKSSGVICFDICSSRLAPYFLTATFAFSAAADGYATLIPADNAFFSFESVLNIAIAIGLLQVFPLQTNNTSLLICYHPAPCSLKKSVTKCNSYAVLSGHLGKNHVRTIFISLS